MQIHTDQFSISTKGDSEVIDITSKVQASIGKHALTEGLATVFVVGSTLSVTTTEFEPGLRRDIPEALERLAPRHHRYHHDDTWHDGNGHAHVRAAMMGCSLAVPFQQGELMLGTWQQIVVVDHDNRPRTRTIVVQVMGK